MLPPSQGLQSKAWGDGNRLNGVLAIGRVTYFPRGAAWQNNLSVKFTKLLLTTLHESVIYYRKGSQNWGREGG